MQSIRSDSEVLEGLTLTDDGLQPVHSSACVTTLPPFLSLSLYVLGMRINREHLLWADSGTGGQCGCLNKLLLTDVATRAKI